jgi:hypothetical protein
MTIQTSQITTASNGNLTLNPNGTGKIVLQKMNGTDGERPLGAANTDGEVHAFNHELLQEVPNGTTEGDLIMVQREDPVTGDPGYFSADASLLGGVPLLGPLPRPSMEITFEPHVIGSGTLDDPFLLSEVVVRNPGDSAQSNETCTITTEERCPALLLMADGSESPAKGRFEQIPLLVDETKTASFNFSYIDRPNTTPGEGQRYDGLIDMGLNSVYVKFPVIQLANVTDFGPVSSPNAAPSTVDYPEDGKYGSVSATWSDGDRTLGAKGSLIFGVNGGTLDAIQKSVSDGDTVEIGYNLVDVNIAIEGEPISGTLYSVDGGYESFHSMRKDITADTFRIDPLDDQGLSTVVTTGNNPLTGINSPTPISLLSSTLTNVELSIAGSAFSSGPWTFNPGDLLQARGTTGGTVNTTYNAVFSVNGVSYTWEVKTHVNSPSIAQPTIISPANGTHVDPPFNFVSDTYDPYEGAGPHQSSDWEVYAGNSSNPEVGPIVTVNDKIVTYSDPANFTSPNSTIESPGDAFDGTFGVTDNREDFNFAQTSTKGVGKKLNFVFPEPLFVDVGVDLALGNAGQDSIEISYKINGVSYSDSLRADEFVDSTNTYATTTLDGGLVAKLYWVRFSDSNKNVAAFKKYLEPYLLPGYTGCKLQAIVSMEGPFELLGVNGVSNNSISRAKFFGVWLGDRWLDDSTGATELFFNDDQASNVSNFVTGDNVIEVGNGDDGTGFVSYAHYIGDELGSTQNKVVLSQIEPNWGTGSYVKNRSRIVLIKTPPASDLPNPSNYTLINSSLADTTNLESYSTSVFHAMAGPITGVTSANYNLPAGRRFTNKETGPGNSALVRNTTAFTVTEATLSCWFRDWNGQGGEVNQRDQFYAEFNPSNDTRRTSLCYSRKDKAYMVVQFGTNVKFPVPGGEIPFGEWHHVVFKIVGSQTSVYHDGIFINTKTTSEAMDNLGIGWPGSINTQNNTKYGRFDQCELIFVSDKAYDPTNFGYTTDSGEWVTLSRQQVLKNLNSDFGKNGFYLDYDPSTGGGELADKSGNGNDFTEGEDTLTTAISSPDTPGQDNVTELSFAGGTDLTLFGIGNDAEEVGNGDDGVGTIAFVDTNLSKVYLDAVEPNWDAGSYLKSPMELDSKTHVFSRVKYRSNDPIESEWSNWNSTPGEN